MDIISDAYFEGQATGVLVALEALNPDISKEDLQELYRETLKKVSLDTGWVDYFFPTSEVE